MPSIRNLRIFQEVCRTRNLTRAAENLYMTQPAVSQALKELESNAGFPLFDPLSKKRVLTPSGEIYLEKALHLLAVYDELTENPEAIEKQASLRLGSCITIACHWLPAFLQRVKREECFKLQVTVDRAGEIMARLRSHEIDFALYEGIPPDAPFRIQSLFQYRLLPVCPTEHPFAGQKGITIHDFLQLPLLLRETGSAVRDALDNGLYAEGFRASPVMTSANSQAIIQCVQAGFGLSLLPEPSVAAALAAGSLASFEIDGFPLYIQASLVYHDQKHLSRPMTDFLSSVSAEALGAVV